MIQVLVVDDSPVMRRYVARTLAMIGLDIAVHEAGNGREAIDKAFEIRPDLIITDLNMPEMSGDELVAQLYEIPDLLHTPVIVMSADRSADRPHQLMHAGALDYMTKPLSPEALKRRIVSIVEGRLMSLPASVLDPVLSQIFEAMYFCIPSPVGAARLEGQLTGAAVAFSGGRLSGSARTVALTGEFRVILKRTLAAQMAADFLALDSDELTTTQVDGAVRELANVLCGATMSAWWPREDLRFGIPRELPPEVCSAPHRHCFSVTRDEPEMGVAVVVNEGSRAEIV